MTSKGHTINFFYVISAFQIKRAINKSQKFNIHSRSHEETVVLPNP